MSRQLEFPNGEKLIPEGKFQCPKCGAMLDVLELRDKIIGPLMDKILALRSRLAKLGGEIF